MVCHAVAKREQLLGRSDRDAGEVAGELAGVGGGAMRELPQVGPAAMLRPLHQQHPRPAPQHHRKLLNLHNRRRRSAHRDLILQTELPRLAHSLEGAEEALRLCRRADQRLELHQGLVEVAGVVVGKDVLGGLPEPGERFAAAGVVAASEQPAQHAPAVRLQDRQTLPERLRQDRAQRVTTDARQIAGGLGITREFSAVPLDHEARGTMQIAGTSIVAKPFPAPQHLAFLGGRQRAARPEMLAENARSTAPPCSPASAAA